MILDGANNKITSNDSNWIVSLTATQAESNNVSAILTTENKFIDKNISIRTTIPAAATPTLSITDKGSTNITIGTASGGYYPLSTSLTGTLTVGTAGWINTTGLQATDSSVTVGRIAQSTMTLGGATLASGASVTPSVNGDQTITITMGYNAQRTIVIKGMNNGTTAEATVSISKAASTPTLANTSSAVSGKSQVTIAPTTANTGITKYYIAMTATAPATSFSTDNGGGITRTLDTAGYLGAVSQISASGTTTQATRLYYAPLATAALTVTPSVTVSPTASNVSKTVSGKTQITASPSTGTSGISTYYMALNITAPATSISQTKSGFSAGYLGADSEITAASANTTAKTNVYYIPIASGALANNGSTVSATGYNMQFATSGTDLSTAPTSGPYIGITGNGNIKVGTAGWIAQDTNLSSTSTTKYYKIKEGAVSWNQSTGVVSVTEGYVTSGSGFSLGRGSLANVASSGITYAEASSPVLAEEGYLYINAGYFPDTKISLSTLIPDDTDYENAGNSHILFGYEAYDTTGKKLIGAIATYDGSYTTG